MHEIAIAQAIVDEAKKQGAEKGIQVEIGELAELTPEELEQALKGVTKMFVQVDYKESLVKCACGYEGKANILDKGHGYCYFNCPNCGSKPQVIDGGGIKLIGIE